MARIQLKPGERVTMQVLAVNTVTEDQKTIILFKGMTHNDAAAEFAMSPDSAKRQLDRIEYNWSTVKGAVVEFEKTPMNAQRKSFININRADAVTAPAQATSLPPVAGALPGADLPPMAGAPDLPTQMALPPTTPVMSEEEKAERFQALAAYQYKCLQNAVLCCNTALMTRGKNGEEPIGTTPDAVVAYSATLFIAAQKEGLI